MVLGAWSQLWSPVPGLGSGPWSLVPACVQGPGLKSWLRPLAVSSAIANATVLGTTLCICARHSSVCDLNPLTSVAISAQT